MEKKEKKNIVVRFLTNIYTKNILLMAVVFLAIVFVVLFGLDRYTQHGEEVVVPETKGLQAKEAINLLSSKGLRFDTIVANVRANVAPGAVYDQVPKGNSKVKKGHIIYLMIYSKDGALIAVPSVKDFSLRQAEQQLKSRGFNVTITVEPSPYKDIVLEAQYKGKTIESGRKIPRGSSITLVVGSGTGEEATDSIQVQSDSSFF